MPTEKPNPTPPAAPRVSLRARLAALLLVAAMAGAVVQAAITRWPGPQLLAGLDEAFGLAWTLPAPDSIAAAALAMLLLAPLVLVLSARLVAPLGGMLRALEGAVMSYRDGDFSMSLATDRRDELGELVRLHNALGQALRDQRQHIVERELLLDTVVQNTPVALLLTDPHDRIVYANIAARHLLGEGRSLEGGALTALMQRGPEALMRAVQDGEDALFTIDAAGTEETFHLSQRGFRLQGRPHRLHLFRRMTRELSRQEVATWKRVIRVISHELNNSLAPISSLAHSGAELARRGDLGRLPGVFASIGERAQHLHGFIEGYARFAKLPQPQPQPVDWPAFLDGIAAHSRFRRSAALPNEPGWFDPTQMEQALINLLKNAHEAGGGADEVTLDVTLQRDELRFDVADRGPGMSDVVLGQALLPFYSTKRAGTGIGLALAREIAEAHGGRIALANRVGGGLQVSITLPASRSATHIPSHTPP